MGDKLPSVEIESISRNSLALYAKASGDHNPIHIDFDYAKEVGLDDVIAHGMLIMAYLGRTLTDSIDQNNILEYGVKFSSLINIGDSLLCTGCVTDIQKNDSKKLLKIELKVENQHRDKKLTGYTIINIS
mgnify:FL=1